MSTDNALLPVPIQEAPPPAVAAVDPTVARNESIALLLNTAYQRASMLELTDDESAHLMAPFSDEAYSRRDARTGDQSIVYLEHAYIRDRLLQVFGPGKWTTISRRQWVDRESDTIYVDMVMLARGAYVGESVGCQKYNIGGHRLSYGEALSGAESDAISRICGKLLGIGLDAWKKSFREEWKRRNPVGGSPAGQPIDQGYREPAPAKTNGGKKPTEHPPVAGGGKAPARTPEETKAYVLSRIQAARNAADIQEGETLLGKIRDWLGTQKLPADVRADLDLAIADADNALASVGMLSPQDAGVNQEQPTDADAADAARKAEETWTVPIMGITTLLAIAEFKQHILPMIDAALRPRVEQLVLIHQLTMETNIARCVAIKEDHPELEYQANLRITEIKDAAKMEAGAKT